MATVLVESKHQMASMPAVDATSIRFWISWLSNNALLEFDAADGRHARGSTSGERGKLGQGQHRKIFKFRDQFPFSILLCELQSSNSWVVSNFFDSPEHWTPNWTLNLNTRLHIQNCCLWPLFLYRKLKCYGWWTLLQAWFVQDARVAAWGIHQSTQLLCHYFANHSTECGLVVRCRLRTWSCSEVTVHPLLLKRAGRCVSTKLPKGPWSYSITVPISTNHHNKTLVITTNP